MACLHPIWIVNKRFTCCSPEERQNLLAEKPWLRDSLYLAVPCGKCPDCLKARRNDWYVRLNREYARQKSMGNVSWFLTLTIKPELYNEAIKSPAAFVRRFFEKIRHRHGSSIKHFLCCELGGRTGRLHYHGLLFGPKLSYSDLHSLAEDFGWIWLKPTDSRNIRYTVKYILKDTSADWYSSVTSNWSASQHREFRRLYTSAGLGEYLGTFPPPSEENRIWTFLDSRSGISYKYAIPRYYRKFSSLQALERMEIISAYRCSILANANDTSILFKEAFETNFPSSLSRRYLSADYIRSVFSRFIRPLTPLPTVTFTPFIEPNLSFYG